MKVNTAVIHTSDEITGMENIAERLRRLRTAADLTQAQLAKAAGVSQGAIGNIESGIRGYGKSLVQIARVLGVPAEYLNCETDTYAVLNATLPAINSNTGGSPAPGAHPSKRHIDPDFLRELGDAIESAPPSDRDGAVALLTTYIANPSANVDLLPLIARRLSGEPDADEQIPQQASR